MAQLVAGLEEGTGTAADAPPPLVLRRETRAELEAIQSAYPLALGAAVRAGSPGCSALEFAGALESANRDCADAITSVVRGCAAGLPRAVELLGRLSHHQGAPVAVLARAGAAPRVAGARDDEMGGKATGVFPHGSALRRLAFDAARTDASAARPARREPTAALAATLPASRPWTAAGLWQGAAGAEPRAAPLHRPPPTSEPVAAGYPAFVSSPLPPACAGDASGRLAGVFAFFSRTRCQPLCPAHRQYYCRVRLFVRVGR